MHIGYWDRALESALKNLTAAEASGSARDIANCRYNLAGFRGRRGEYDQSMELYRQAKAYFDETGNRLRGHLALWNIVNVFKARGKGRRRWTVAVVHWRYSWRPGSSMRLR